MTQQRAKEREYVYLAQGCLDARDVEFRGLPQSVIVCPRCHGNGKRLQNYFEGRMTGPCDFCESSGFVYRNTARAVPLSVTNQIAVASGLAYRRYAAHGIDWFKDKADVS